MPIVTSYTSKAKARRIQAAAAAVRRARQQIIASRRRPLAPPRTGGFWGTRRTGVKELKVIDTAPTSITIDASGDVILLNGVATGTDFTDRIGRKIILKSISMRCGTFASGTSEGAGDLMRLLVIYDTQTNGAAPAVTDVLTSASPFAHMNLNNRDRFKVLYDELITINGSQWAAGALTAGTPSPTWIQRYKKLRHEQIFQGTAATVASIATGGIFFIPIALVDDLTSLQYCFRIRFEDA